MGEARDGRGVCVRRLRKKKIKREGLCVVGWKRRRRCGNRVDGCCGEGFFFQGRERRLGENGVLGLGLGLGFCLCCLPNVQNYPPFMCVKGYYL